MDLKELLGEELAGQVEEKLGENHKIIDTKEGEWIPKDKFDQINADNKELKKQLKDRDGQLANLKDQAKGNDELQKEIEELQKENKDTKDEYEQKLIQQSFDHALDRSLSSAKVRNTKAVKALLDMDTIKQDGDDLKGLDEQLKNLKENEPYLFEEMEEEGEDKKPTFSQGEHKKQSGGEDPFVAALGLKGGND
ncbi:phage scaffolding protein [Salibacterium aidingense]|uniref:phage scaffolding protein n=1 Tax=Salibacterium aidingense TaxID=384933 RepID=UPI003BD0F97E